MLSLTSSAKYLPFKSRVCPKSPFSLLFFYLFFMWEVLIGRINVLAIFLLLFMSPVFDSLSSIIGFPVRLQLSSWSGHLLHYAGFAVQVEGNVMVMNNASFSVDDACMGLNMLAVSLLMGVFVMGSMVNPDTFISINIPNLLNQFAA